MMNQVCHHAEALPQFLPLAASPSLSISVIVPVRNEARCIQRTLTQLLEQRYDPDRFEVIVIDGQSTDDTCAIVRELQASYPNLHLLHNAKRWSSAGRNLGVRAARGEIVVVVDGHADVDNPDYLRTLEQAFRRSGADCVGRPQPQNVSGASDLQRAIAAARSSRLGHNPGSWIYAHGERFVRPQSVAVAYRASVFDAIGLFDEDFDACEDVEFNHRLDRAGLCCFFTNKVQVRYHPRSSLPGLFHQLRRYGQGRVRLLCKHPDSFTVPCFAPALFVLGVMVGPILGLLSPVLAAVYAAVLGVYALSVVSASVTIAFKQRDLRLLPWLPPVFVAIHAGAGIGVLQEAVRRGLRGVRRRSAVRAQGEPEKAKAGPLSCLSPFAFPLPLLPSPQSPRILNALTIDVEDYFQVSGFEACVSRDDWHQYPSRVVANTHKILDILDSASVRATFFMLGWVAQKHPALVRSIQSAGHEIGCHSYWHRLIYTQCPDDFRSDLRRARDVLEDITGEPIIAYRAPSFSITQRSLWALDILIEEGFRFDSSIYPTHHDRYGIAGAPTRPYQIVRPAGTLWEFPMAIFRWFGYPVPVGGGGYLRLYPYWFTQHGLRAINAEGRPFVVYLHPWELDPDQPRLRPGRAKAFRHYVNLHRTEKRLQRLLEDFSLGSIGDVHTLLDQRGELPSIDLSRAA
jgi:polysaccharide deacetylase family protein (PEP-CTERM system associated)